MLRGALRDLFVVGRIRSNCKILSMSKIKNKQRHVPWIVAVIVGSVVLTLEACHRVTSPENVPQASTAGSRTAALQTPYKGGGLPQCPDGNAVSNPPPAAAMHHRVALSWNASTSAGHPGYDPVGYCIYRSEHQISVKRLKDCKDCEQVSPVPIISTGCVDNLVKDGKTYFYVAITINPGKQISDFSNQTMAIIPPDKASIGSPSLYPSCRETEQPAPGEAPH
jgi:hypothetical protein